MTGPTRRQPTDAQTFNDALTELLRNAAENGISVERAWECRVRDGPQWEVEVVPIVAEGSDR